MKAILLSINPEHALNILNGKKTLELRKRVPKGFIGWVYVYVTKGKPFLEPRECNGNFVWNIHNDFIYHTDLNGTIPFRFWFDKYETYTQKKHGLELYTDVSEYDVPYRELEQLQLDYREVENYGKGKDLYAWHIKKLEIFDKPMKLSELYGKQQITKSQLDFISRHQVGDENYEYYRLTKAPQSYQYVWVKE